MSLFPVPFVKKRCANCGRQYEGDRNYTKPPQCLQCSAEGKALGVPEPKIPHPTEEEIATITQAVRAETQTVITHLTRLEQLAISRPAGMSSRCLNEAMSQLEMALAGLSDAIARKPSPALSKQIRTLASHDSQRTKAPRSSTAFGENKSRRFTKAQLEQARTEISRSIHDDRTPRERYLDRNKEGRKFSPRGMGRGPR